MKSPAPSKIALIFSSVTALTSNKVCPDIAFLLKKWYS